MKVAPLPPLLVPLPAADRADAWGKDWSISTPLRRAAQEADTWSPTAGIFAAGDPLLTTCASFLDALLTTAADADIVCESGSKGLHHHIGMHICIN